MRWMALAGLAIGCAPQHAVHFPVQAAMVRDPDLDFVSVPCRTEATKKDPNHVVCAPETYVSPLAWDAGDNMLFRPMSDTFAVRASKEAVNANHLDEVFDSAWFTNRISTIDIPALQRGACRSDQMLDPSSTPDATWVIDQGKGNGSSLGFRINIKGKGKYLLKSDPAKDSPERASAASVIGASIYNAAGFNTSCEQIVRFKRSLLKLTPGLKYADNSGVERDFDEHALDALLAEVGSRDGLIRMQASAWLPGRLLGPFRYEGTRDDDPSDVVPHEDRRELRGGRLLAAWIDHFDAREQNTMDSWIAQDSSSPDSSPGYVRHFYLDTSDALGSEWAWDALSKRLGHSYILDWGDIGVDFLTMGTLERPWDRVNRAPGFEEFGYLNAHEFVAEKWLNEYPNPAFSRMSERDGAWMARILSRFTGPMIRALTSLGQFAKPTASEYLAGVLELRLQRILDRYLTRLSPIGELFVSGEKLCGVDFAARSFVRSPSLFHFTASGPQGAIAVERLGDSTICVPLPHGSGSAEMSIVIHDDVAPGALIAHVYDTAGGFRLAGIER